MAERDQTADGGIAGVVRDACALGLVGLACFRAIVGFEPMPWWSSDPFESQVFATGLTPAAAVWLDAAAIILAGAGLAVASATRTLRVWIVAMGVLGTVAAAVWATRTVPGNAIESSRLAWAWIAAVWSAVALAHVCQGPRRGIAIALLLGVVGMLAAKGAMQVLVEHADTVAWYERDPDAFLRAHGWEPGSVQARGYERRLYQTEATGWFGLSNVYATVVGASGVGLLAMAAVGALERRRVGPLLALAVGGLAGLASLAMCGSKGGAVAAAAGAGAAVAVGGIAWFLHRRGTDRGAQPATPEPKRSRRSSSRVGVAVALAVAAIPPIAVIVRGQIGERIGELSLLFRWFYAQGAAEIAARHWTLGVGPSGFRDAYLAARPPLAVEDVISPHSLPWDLVTAFGIPAGIAWLGVIVLLAASAAAAWWGAASGERMRGSPALGDRPPDRAHHADEVKLAALLAIVATGVAASIERALTTPETAVLRIVGVAAWVLIAWGVIAIARTSPRAIAAGVCAAAAVALLHIGIEVTPTWVGAQTWLFALLGIAGAARASAPSPVLRDRAAPVRVAIPVLCAAGLLALAPWHVPGWQARIKAAAALAGDIGRLNDQMRALENDPALAAELGISPDSVRREVAALSGAVPAPTPQAFADQMAALEVRRAREALDILRVAAPPQDVPTRRAADRAAQRLARTLVEQGRLGDAAAIIGERAEQARDQAGHGGSVILWSHSGSLLSVRAEILEQMGDADAARAARLAARECYERAAAMDPWGVHHPVRAARLSDRVGDSVAAAGWARRALANHANARLDPLAGLSDAEHGAMRALAALGDDPEPSPQP